jgi:hypothetical protein
LRWASCRSSHVRNAPLSTVGPKKAACRDGNIYRHDYDELLHELIWGTVHNRLSDLLSTVNKELAEL